MGRLEGKTALVTGASSGIGRATAIRLVREGAALALCARGADRLDAVRSQVERLGGRCFTDPCDVAQMTDCTTLVSKAEAVFGGIDILVNNAGVGYSGSVADSDPVEVEEMIRVNFLGVYQMTRAALPAMIESGAGDIVNIGSVAGLKYSPNFGVYSATKFAVRAFSEALRNEVQGQGIRVGVVHPGMTQTAFFESFSKGGSPVPTDKGDILSADEIAEAILFMVTRPEGAAVNEMTVRPSWQER
jgi:NADP-dependent 3-hydroxy acid dehydrogenase YdfG